MAVSFVSSSSNKSTTTSVVITAPVNIRDGDILVAFVSVFRSTSATATTPTGTGWTAWANQTILTRYKCSIFWKRASSESGNYTFNSASATQMQGAIGVYRGCVESVDPKDALSNVPYITNNLTIQAGSLTKSQANETVIFAAWCYLAGGISLANVFGWNHRENQVNTDCALQLSDYVFGSAGSTGTITAFAGASCTVKHAFMVGLKASVEPTTTTQAVTNITATTATGNGNITATGGANATRRGFCYMTGTSGDPTTANSVAYEDGSFGTGAYTKSITGLSAGTNYRFRAYAVNSAGTSYGTTVQLTTAVAQSAPTVVLNSPVDAGSGVTPVLNFTATDTENDVVEYEVQIDTVNTFDSVALIDALSVSDAGFTAGHPFASGAAIDYTVQATLAADTYYWRVRAKDPAGLNVFGAWSTVRSFTVSGSAGPYLLKYHTGAGWALKPLKYYTGSVWVTKPLKVYTGTEWVLVN